MHGLTRFAVTRFAVFLALFSVLIVNYSAVAAEQISKEKVFRPEGFTPLMEACLNGDLSKVRELVESGAKTNAVDKYKATVFMWAVMGGSLDVVKYMVTKSVDYRRKGEITLREQKANDRSEKWYRFGNALSVACGMGYYDLAEYLIKELDLSPNDEQVQFSDGPDDCHCLEYFKKTPLHTAAEMGQTVLCRLLVENGAKIEAEGFYWRDTPFLKAALNGHLDTCQYLVSVGGDINAKDAFGKNALHYAAWMGRMDLVLWLISKGFDVNNRESFNSETPLHKAATSGHTSTCKLLIEHGADIYTKDKHGDIPFVHAAFEGHEETCKFFIENTIIKTDKKALNDAMLAAAVNCNGDTVEYLLDCGADPNARNAYGGTALHRGCRTRALIAHGADVNVKDREGYVPLHWAHTKELVQLLIESGANVDIENNEGATPLHIAGEYGCLWEPEAIKLLIFFGTDINHKDKHGRTPLHYAAKNGQKETCGLLVKMGADLTVKDHYGKTPAKLAKSFFGRDLYLYLKSLGDSKNTN